MTVMNIVCERGCPFANFPGAALFPPCLFRPHTRPSPSFCHLHIHSPGVDRRTSGFMGISLNLRGIPNFSTSFPRFSSFVSRSVVAVRFAEQNGMRFPSFLRTESWFSSRLPGQTALISKSHTFTCSQFHLAFLEKSVQHIACAFAFKVLAQIREQEENTRVLRWNDQDCPLELETEVRWQSCVLAWFFCELTTNNSRHHLF